MIITILISLLTTFLEYFFMKWLKEHFGGIPKDLGVENWRCPTPEEVQSGKTEFLNRISRPWNFYLGFNRVRNAGILFDKSVSRYQPSTAESKGATGPMYYQAFYTGNFKSLIEGMTHGLSVP